MNLKLLAPTYLLIILAHAVTVPQAAHAILQKGQLAPAIKATCTTGQPVSLASYKGSVLVIDFFATWCGPCRDSIPHLINLSRKYGKQGLQVLGLSVDEDGDKAVKDFVRDKRITYPVALADDDLQADYGLRSVPTIFIVNKKGIVAEKFYGFSDEIGKSMEALIKKLLLE